MALSLAGPNEKRLTGRNHFKWGLKDLIGIHPKLFFNMEAQEEECDKLVAMLKAAIHSVRFSFQFVCLFVSIFTLRTMHCGRASCFRWALCTCFVLPMGFVYVFRASVGFVHVLRASGGLCARASCFRWAL